MKYILIAPDETEHDITDYVLRGLQYIHEIAFDLESSVLPSNIDVKVDNITGAFDPTDGLLDQEFTSYILRIKEGDITVFVGILTDIILEDHDATLKVRSVNQFLANASIGALSMTGTPAEIVKEVLAENLTLPGLFVDTINFNNVQTAEEDRDIEIVANISAEDEVTLAAFLQEINKITGLYVYSQNGVLTCLRYGEYSELIGYDYAFIDEVIAGKTKKSRPILWQKTRAVVPYHNGESVTQAAKNMSDYFGVTGDSLIEAFREKTIESDGLAGKLYHSTLVSAEACLRDILGWRGFPRWEVKFEVDVLEPINRAKLIEIPLFARTLHADKFGYIVGGLIDKKIYDTRAELTLLSIKDPTFHHPERVLSPAITHAIEVDPYSVNVTKAIFEVDNNTGRAITMEYVFENGDPAVIVEMSIGDVITVENNSKTNARARFGLTNPAGVTWYNWRDYPLAWPEGRFVYMDGETVLDGSKPWNYLA